jgi:hypothetical protein
MPSEVSDIKQFIEICRRKDASCTFYNFLRREVEEEGEIWRLETDARRKGLGMRRMRYNALRE